MIGPSMASCEHTLNTLRYADRVKELAVGESEELVVDQVYEDEEEELEADESLEQSGLVQLQTSLGKNVMRTGCNTRRVWLSCRFWRRRWSRPIAICWMVWRCGGSKTPR